MFNKILAVFLLVGYKLVACAPEGETKSIIRPTRQVLPVGAYPGAYPTAAYPGAYPTAAYPGAYPTAAYPRGYPTPGYPGGYHTAGYPVTAYTTALPTGIPGGAVFRRPINAGSIRPAPGPVGPVPSGPEGGARIVNQIQEGPDFEGNFNFAFETENGIANQASGALTNLGTEAEGQAMRGSFSYTSPEGLPITVNWYADETGFHAEGEHLPRQPIVPNGPEVPYPYGGLGGVRGPIPIGRGIPPGVVGPRPVPLIRPDNTVA